MKSVTEMRGLGDIRTSVSSHQRSTTRHKGTTYFEILSLGIERLRLDTELAWIYKRQGRIEKRMGEIRGSLGKRLQKAQHDQDGVPPRAPGTGGDDERKIESRPPMPQMRNWKKITVDY
ncbi:MAG: hypothetical protein HY666_03795 [Chloroflexi bacterium]|nr:hypothetical protein [Chloroflexota bacterium]